MDFVPPLRGSARLVSARPPQHDSVQAEPVLASPVHALCKQTGHPAAGTGHALARTANTAARGGSG